MAYESLHPTQRRFLLCYEACASVTQAARWAKIHRQNHYDWMRESEAYRAAFEDAEPRATKTLEDEAVRRAHQGIRKAVRYKGKVVGYETEFSDQLMALLLKGGNPAKFKERMEHSGEVKGKLSLNAVDELIGE